MFAIGANEYYSPNFLNTGAWGNYASITGKFTAPSSTFGSAASACTSPASSAGSGSELPTRSTERASPIPASRGPFPNGIKYADYNTWNIGIGFTYKVFTLDIRYSDTNLSKGDCNAFTSDFAARGNITAFTGTSITAINPDWRSAPTGAARPASSSSRLT